MDFILDIIEQNQVYIIIGLVVLSIVFLIIAIVNSAKCSSLKKKYDAFMQGKDGKSLEDDILFRLEQIDELIESNAANERNIDLIFKRLICVCFWKCIGHIDNCCKTSMSSCKTSGFKILFLH